MIRSSYSVLLLCCILSAGSISEAQISSTQFKTAVHPRVFATGAGRAALLEKIQDVPWARELFTEMKTDVDQALATNGGDRGYLPSRLQMNWEPGKRYTDFYTKGNFIPIRKGDAPFPTVRVAYGRAATGSTPAPRMTSSHHIAMAPCQIWLMANGSRYPLRARALEPRTSIRRFSWKPIVPRFSTT